MRKGSYVLGLTLMGVVALPCSPGSAQPYSQQGSGSQIDFGVFYDGLAPYGDWVEMPDYGWSWAPRVEGDWRPYTRGQWIMTDDGWFWDSDEPFGWATYHYGRWLNDPEYGWVWIPGTEWAPAWVSWRHGNGYTGWAPLPPRATWQTRVGLNIGGLDIDAFIGADDYAFVQDRSFVDRGVYQRFLPRNQNLTIIHATNNVTHYSEANNRVFNGGIAIANVELAVGRSVPRARTVDVSRADAPRSAVAGQVAVFRPQVRVAPDRRPAQGKSLVKGEAPPPLLLERRNVRAQERQQKGNQPAVSAKAVQTQPPAAPQNAVGPGAKAQTQQQLDAQAQAAQRAKDAQLAHDQAQSHQQQLDQQRMKQQSDAQAQQKVDAQAQAAQRAKDAQLAHDQAQSHQQQLDQQRMKQQSDAQAQQRVDAQAQAAQRAKDAQLAHDQAQGHQQQLDQLRAKQQSDAQAQQRVDAQAQAGKRAQDAQQADQRRAKDAQQQAHPKASPTPAPAGH